MLPAAGVRLVLTSRTLFLNCVHGRSGCGLSIFERLDERKRMLPCLFLLLFQTPLHPHVTPDQRARERLNGQADDKIEVRDMRRFFGCNVRFQSVCAESQQVAGGGDGDHPSWSP